MQQGLTNVGCAYTRALFLLSEELQRTFTDYNNLYNFLYALDCCAQCHFSGERHLLKYIIFDHFHRLAQITSRDKYESIMVSLRFEEWSLQISTQESMEIFNIERRISKRKRVRKLRVLLRVLSAFMGIYDEVTFRPGNQGYLRAMASFERNSCGR